MIWAGEQVFGSNANVCLGLGCWANVCSYEKSHTIVTCFDLLSVPLPATVVFVRDEGRKPPKRKGQDMTQGEREDILSIVRTERERAEEALVQAHRLVSSADRHECRSALASLRVVEDECRSALVALRLVEDRLTDWMGH